MRAGAVAAGQRVSTERAVRRPAWLPETRDIAVAALAVAAGQLVAWTGWIGEQPQHGSRLENAVVSALALAAVAWRRTAPLSAVVAYATVFCFLQPFAPHDLPVWTGFLPLVLLTLNAAYRTDRRSAVTALVVALTGLTVLTTVEPVLQSWDTYIFNAALVVPAWFAARSLTARNQRARQLSENLATLAAAQEERERRAVNEERTRVARELHDVVAHSVTVLLIQVGSARVLLDSSAGQAREQLLAAERSGREALEELRRLLRVLRSPHEDDRAPRAVPAPQPMLRDVQALVETFRSTGSPVTLALEGPTEEVGPGLALTVYRIVQEALTNALKHAPGAEVQVQVTVGPDQVQVVVHNGSAASAPAGSAATGEGTGLGLIGLRERASLLGGQLEAGPRGSGWLLSATLPRLGSRAAVDGRL